MESLEGGHHQVDEGGQHQEEQAGAPGTRLRHKEFSDNLGTKESSSQKDNTEHNKTPFGRHGSQSSSCPWPLVRLSQEPVFFDIFPYDNDMSSFFSMFFALDYTYPRSADASLLY